MQLTALLLLALFPFVGIALLIMGAGPKRTAARAYRRAREHTREVAEAADRENEQLAEADARLAESQRRLRGETPASPPSAPPQNV